MKPPGCLNQAKNLSATVHQHLKRACLSLDLDRVHNNVDSQSRRKS